MLDCSNPLIAQVQGIYQRAQDRVRAEKLSCPQLPLWPETSRAAPNEIVRSALFNARNRKSPRLQLKKASVAVIGEGRITYTGEELRQDDETVWMQLIHLAKDQVLDKPVEFTRYSICKAIGWPLTGQSYERLHDVLTRLQATSLSVYSKRLGKGVSLAMIPYFDWQDEFTEKPLPIWRVRVAPELVLLFSDVQYTRIEWQQRLDLPDGLATWLHGYLASHKSPYPIKIETIRLGSGLTDATKCDLKKTVIRALKALVKVGFLGDFSVEGDLVTVERLPANY